VDTSAFSARLSKRRWDNPGKRVEGSGRQEDYFFMFASVRTPDTGFAAIFVQVEEHPARFPTLAVNCEFLPAISLLFMAFGKSLDSCGHSAGHKNLTERLKMARLCGENS